MIALNHSFVANIMTAPLTRAHAALLFAENVRRRMGALPLVHEELWKFDCGHAADISTERVWCRLREPGRGGWNLNRRGSPPEIGRRAFLRGRSQVCSARKPPEGRVTQRSRDLLALADIAGAANP
jgi:hypothetical protein